jgi:hypothetical protein
MTPLHAVQADLMFLEPRLSSITQVIINQDVKNRVPADELLDKELYLPRFEKISQKLTEICVQPLPSDLAKNFRQLKTEWFYFEEELTQFINQQVTVSDSLKTQAASIASIVSVIRKQIYKPEVLGAATQAQVSDSIESEPTAEEIVSHFQLREEATTLDFSLVVTTQRFASVLFKIVSHEYGERFFKALQESDSAIFAQEAFVQLLIIDSIQTDIPLHSIELFRGITTSEVEKSLIVAVKDLKLKEIEALFFEDAAPLQNIKELLTKLSANCRLTNLSFRALLSILEPITLLTENDAAKLALREQSADNAVHLIKKMKDPLAQSWCYGEIAQRLITTDIDAALKITKVIPDKKRKALRYVTIVNELYERFGIEKTIFWINKTEKPYWPTCFLALTDILGDSQSEEAWESAYDIARSHLDTTEDQSLALAKLASQIWNKNSAKALRFAEAIPSKERRTRCFVERVEQLFSEKGIGAAYAFIKEQNNARLNTDLSAALYEAFSKAHGNEKALEWLQLLEGHEREIFILNLVEFKLRFKNEASDDDALSLLLLLPSASAESSLRMYNFAHNVAERDLEKAIVFASKIQNKALSVRWFFEMMSIELFSNGYMTDEEFNEQLNETVNKYLDNFTYLHGKAICSYKPQELLSEVLSYLLSKRSMDTLKAMQIAMHIQDKSLRCNSEKTIVSGIQASQKRELSRRIDKISDRGCREYCVALLIS